MGSLVIWGLAFFGLAPLAPLSPPSFLAFFSLPPSFSPFPFCPLAAAFLASATLASASSCVHALPLGCCWRPCCLDTMLTGPMRGLVCLRGA